MAEIKSTLEIIMEKTKGLTMSEEEKAEIRHKELSGKVRGLVQKFLDGIMDLDRFKADTAALGEERGEAAKKIIKEEAIARISPGADNDRLLEMLGGVTGMDAGPAHDLLEEYEGLLQEEAAARMQALWEALEQKGIRGSAVVPNLDADPEWKAYIVKTGKDLQEKLAEIMTS